MARRTDLEAAEAMLTGSLFAGIAFSYARLGNVHAMSHPVSAFFDVPQRMPERKLKVPDRESRTLEEVHS